MYKRQHPILFTQRKLTLLDEFSGEFTDSVLKGEDLKAYFRRYGTKEASLDELLRANESPSIDERRPILLQGELANPYRLQEITWAHCRCSVSVWRASAERGPTDWTPATPILASIM